MDKIRETGGNIRQSSVQNFCWGPKPTEIKNEGNAKNIGRIAKIFDELLLHI